MSLGKVVESVGAGGGDNDPFLMASMRAFAKASISGDGGSPCSFWSCGIPPSSVLSLAISCYVDEWIVKDRVNKLTDQYHTC